MTRTLAVVAALLSSTAMAQDHFSEPQLVAFRGSEGVVNQTYSFPLIVNVGFLIDYIGVEATATAGSNLLIEMEGESNLAWPDPYGGGDVIHHIEPLANGSRMAMTAEVDVGVDFVIGVFGSDFRFSLLSQSLTFTPEITGFEPFLLPAQSPNLMRIDANAQGGGFQLPFNFSLFDIGVIGVSVGVVFTATPETFSTVRGASLTTMHDGDIYAVDDPTRPSSMYLYENNGEMGFETFYEVNVTTQIGYRFVGSGGLTIRILGQDIPIEITFLDQFVNLFAGIERPRYTSGPYFHPLPKADTPIQMVDFGEVAVDTDAVFTVPLNNEGLLELEGLAVIEGDPEFEVAPAELLADAGRQDAAIITFRPTVAGAFEGELVLQTSDPLQPELRIPITGTGVQKRDDGGPGFDNDDNLYGNDEASTIYSACGCASGPLSSGLAPLLLMPAVLLRRRRQG